MHFRLGSKRPFSKVKSLLVSGRVPFLELLEGHFGCFFANHGVVAAVLGGNQHKTMSNKLE